VGLVLDTPRAPDLSTGITAGRRKSKKQRSMKESVEMGNEGRSEVEVDIKISTVSHTHHVLRVAKNASVGKSIGYAKR